MTVLKPALLDIQADLADNKRVKIGSNTMASMLSEVEEYKILLEVLKAEKLPPLDAIYPYFSVANKKLTQTEKIGTVISKYPDYDGEISGPNKMVERANGEIWIAQYSLHVQMFEKTGDISYLGGWGKLGAFLTTNDYANLKSFAIDDGANKIYLLSQVHHVLRVLNIEDQALVFNFGVKGNFGAVTSGLLYNPKDIALLPDGSFFLANYNGQPTGSILNTGSVSYHGSTGALVTVLLTQKSTGKAIDNETQYPNRLRYDDPKKELWVLTNTELAVFDVTLLPAISYKRSYNRTEGNFDNIIGQAFDINATDIYIAYTGGNEILRINQLSNDVTGRIGLGIPKNEAYVDNPDTPGAFINIQDLLLTPTHIYACDYTNNRIQRFPLTLFDNLKTDIAYTIPIGSNGTFIPYGIDPATGIREMDTLELTKMDELEDIYRIYT